MKFMDKKAALVKLEPTIRGFLINLIRLLLYIIESFTLFNLPVMLVKVLISIGLTFGFCMAFEFAAAKR